MPLRAVIFDSVIEGLKKYFKDHEIEYFFGGSRRFGYATQSSDIDIFVKSADTGLKQMLLDAGFIQITTNIDQYPEVLFRFRNFIDIVLVNDPHRYHKLDRKHVEVDLLVSNNPILRKVALELREFGHTGAQVYRIFSNISIN